MLGDKNANPKKQRKRGAGNINTGEKLRPNNRRCPISPPIHDFENNGRGRQSNRFNV